MEELQLEPNQRKPSQQMRAVMNILYADPYLAKIAGPWVDLERESISWDPIFKIAWGSEHKGAIQMMYSIWTDELRPRSNPFDSVLSLSPKLQTAILKALAIRWGLS